MHLNYQKSVATNQPRLKEQAAEQGIKKNQILDLLKEQALIMMH